MAKGQKKTGISLRLSGALAVLVALSILIPALVQVAKSDEPPPIEPLPPEKAAILAHEQQLLEQALAQPQPPKDVTKPIPAAPQPSVPPEFDIQRIPAGAGTIVENGQAPFPAAQYLFKNLWFEVTNGQKVAVYAGAQGVDLDPTQGVLVIVVNTLDEKTTLGGGAFPTPLKQGAVRVVGAEGERLTLLSDNGSAFYFDVPSCMFVSPAAPAPRPDPTCPANATPPPPILPSPPAPSPAFAPAPGPSPSPSALAATPTPLPPEP